MARVTLIAVIMGLAGCTSQSVYENLQIHRRSECMNA